MNKLGYKNGGATLRSTSFDHHSGGAPPHSGSSGSHQHPSMLSHHSASSGHLHLHGHHISTNPNPSSSILNYGSHHQASSGSSAAHNNMNSNPATQHSGHSDRKSPAQSSLHQNNSSLHQTLHSTAYHHLAGASHLPRIGRSGSSSALWRNEKNSRSYGIAGSAPSTNKSKKQTQSNSEDFRQRMQAREKKPKIIFLDIDGVLHSIRVARQEQLFNPQKMALLRKLIASTDAQVVLSSAWRRTAPTLRMAYQMLNRHGIETPIDVTPDFGICGKRSNEILTWVEKYGIKDWIAIDDLELNAGEPRMRGHFLKCNPLIGLTNDLVEMGVTILSGTRD